MFIREIKLNSHWVWSEIMSSSKQRTCVELLLGYAHMHAGTSKGHLLTPDPPQLQVGPGVMSRHPQPRCEATDLTYELLLPLSFCSRQKHEAVYRNPDVEIKNAPTRSRPPPPPISFLSKSFPLCINKHVYRQPTHLSSLPSPKVNKHAGGSEGLIGPSWGKVGEGREWLKEGWRWGKPWGAHYTQTEETLTHTHTDLLLSACNICWLKAPLTHRFL